MRYICSADGCQLTETDERHIQDGDVLVLKRIQQTIRAVDQRSGSERCLFRSLDQFEIPGLSVTFLIFLWLFTSEIEIKPFSSIVRVV